MGRTPEPIETFAAFLAQAERSPLTIKNYRGDLAAFAAWFEEVNGEAMAPAKVTPTDLRQFKRWLVEQRRLKPSSVNRKLATLKSFLTWAAAAGIAPGLPVPAQGRSWSGPRPVPQERRHSMSRTWPFGVAVIGLLLGYGVTTVFTRD